MQHGILKLESQNENHCWNWNLMYSITDRGSVKKKKNPVRNSVGRRKQNRTKNYTRNSQSVCSVWISIHDYNVYKIHFANGFNKTRTTAAVGAVISYENCKLDLLIHCLPFWCFAMDSKNLYPHIEWSNFSCASHWSKWKKWNEYIGEIYNRAVRVRERAGEWAREMDGKRRIAVTSDLVTTIVRCRDEKTNACSRHSNNKWFKMRIMSLVHEYNTIQYNVSLWNRKTARRKRVKWNPVHHNQVLPANVKALKNECSWKNNKGDDDLYEICCYTRYYIRSSTHATVYVHTVKECGMLRCTKTASRPTIE